MTSADPASEGLLEFLYACPVGLLECGQDGKIRMLNPHAMQHLLPLAAERDATNLFSALEQHAPEVRSLVADHTGRVGRICDGHRVVVDLAPGRRARPQKVLSCTIVRLGPDRLMVTLADISQQVAQEERLREADAWFSAMLHDVDGYAAVTLTPQGRVITVNDCFTVQTGHVRDVVFDRSLAEILDVEGCGDHMRLDDQIEAAVEDGWNLQEGWQRRADGERYWCQRLVVARFDDAGHEPSGFSVVLRDIPRRGAGAEDLRRLLTCDHLTGASNRRHFGDVMERERARWRDSRHPLSLVVLDLDHFKQVNDTYGHSSGDALLRKVAGVCADLLPPRGIFARLGGEEFGVILPRHDGETAYAVAEGMRRAIAAIEIDTPAGMLKATASLGCATMEEVDGSIDTLLALADRRLYEAKRDGRNQVYRTESQAA